MGCINQPKKLPDAHHQDFQKQHPGLQDGIELQLRLELTTTLNSPNIVGHNNFPRVPANFHDENWCVPHWFLDHAKLIVKK